MKISAIIVAAGSGVRMNATTRKQYLCLEAGRPVLALTLEPFLANTSVHDIYLVVPESDMDFCQKTILDPMMPQKPVHLVAGGERRQESVFNGLMALDKQTDFVLIHDGVRPFIRPTDIDACIQATIKYQACIMAIAASDTLKQTDSKGKIHRTLDRKNIWLAQTPQGFRKDLILNAHQKALKDGFKGTDDASLVERLDVSVYVIPGSRNNIKLTHPEDLVMAQALLATGGFVQSESR